MSYLDSLFDLKGKVAVVIGGTGELCGHMAIGLARAGAEVVLVGRNEKKANEKLSVIADTDGSGYFLKGDVATRDSLNSIILEVTKKSGAIDILINGAGINSPTPFLDITEEELSSIMDINFAGTVRACQAFGHYFLREKRPGSIINLGSISGLNPLSRVFTYSASKAAVHNLSKNLAREWAEDGIRVNTLVPGFFPAEQNRKVLDASRVAQILGKTPSNRFGDPDELIGATVLLASEKAGRFITGHELVVDGGFNSMSI
ncbi:SDR family oxidoreductase [Rubritalea spongiae]|uniref:SDR family oxidoreductase n=1 Tax=Rubritalea spongiae TaxID=430797 RepID=A0ABW5E4X2_9BACT